MRVGGEIIIKRIKANFISRWRVSAVVGGFVKQTLKKQWLNEVCILDNDFKRSFTVLLEHHIGEAHVGIVIECALELVRKKSNSKNTLL